MAPPLTDERRQALARKAAEIRRSIVEMVFRANSGHVGGSLGAADIVVTLYHHIMRVDPANLKWVERDRFILSKGHCTPVLYAALADLGYFPPEELNTFRRPGSRLQGHPYEPKTPGVDASTGTLGLGISTALGMALAAKLKQQRQTYFVLCGDGEIQEGQVWEAAMFANKYKLDNVVVFVDRNFQQTDGFSEDVMPMEPLQPKWESFGWNACTIDGHDILAISDAVDRARAQRGRPSVIIARTVKGKGVSFMENNAHFHGAPPTRHEYERAIRELSLAH
jgi:transketolase